MSTMIDALKQAVERASQQSAEERETLAAILTQAMDDDAKWEALFADPLTPRRSICSQRRRWPRMTPSDRRVAFSVS